MSISTNYSYLYGKLQGKYQVGDSIEIQKLNIAEKHITISANTHILTYCSNKVSLEQVLGQKLQLAGIYPIPRNLPGSYQGAGLFGAADHDRHHRAAHIGTADGSIGI